MKREKSFTLIELLVVIAIIGLLATVVMVSVGSVRAKARDAKRIGDIKELSKAIEMYYLENDGYPGETATKVPGGGTGDQSTGIGGGGSYWGENGTGGLITLDTPVPSLPVDPINNDEYFYQYEPSCLINGKKQGYWLQYRSEVDKKIKKIQNGPQHVDPPCGSQGCHLYGNSCW